MVIHIECYMSYILNAIYWVYQKKLDQNLDFDFLQYVQRLKF